MKHKLYTAAELAQDTYFQKWVLKQDQEAHTYWSKWLQEHPEKEEEVRYAIEMVKTLEFGKDIEVNEAFVKVWQSIEVKTIGRRPQKPKYVLAAVACITALLICGYLFIGWMGEPDVYTFNSEHAATSYILPDSSIITLNTNSEVKYQLNKDGNREVWLKGEAYFEVKKWRLKGKSDPSSFTVHTDNADIEVLGTAFNLYEDYDKTQVVLTHGKVKITSDQAQEVYLKPGEFAEVKAKTPIIKKKKVDTDLYTSWTDKKVVFDQTPLSEIAQWIEDRYGKKVIIPDDLDSITFSATLPKISLDLLLETIEVVYYVKVEEKSEVIIIKEK